MKIKLLSEFRYCKYVLTLKVLTRFEMQYIYIVGNRIRNIMDNSYIVLVAF